MKNKDLQISRENLSGLMEGTFSFLPEKMLNKTILFDVFRVDEETIMEKLTCPLLTMNST